MDFLTESIIKGKIVILDNLQEANSTVTKRLNGLLDFKYDEKKKKGSKERRFDIPENPLKNSISIHKDFRIVGVCDIIQMNNMSPVFLNRFDIIILENQLKKINEDEFRKLIKILLDREGDQTKN